MIKLGRALTDVRLRSEHGCWFSGAATGVEYTKRLAGHMTLDLSENSRRVPMHLPPQCLAEFNQPRTSRVLALNGCRALRSMVDLSREAQITPKSSSSSKLWSLFDPQTDWGMIGRKRTFHPNMPIALTLLLSEALNLRPAYSLTLTGYFAITGKLAHDVWQSSLMVRHVALRFRFSPSRVHLRPRHTGPFSTWPMDAMCGCNKR